MAVTMGCDDVVTLSGSLQRRCCLLGYTLPRIPMWLDSQQRLSLAGQLHEI